jgi:hypothetical protein
MTEKVCIKCKPLRAAAGDRPATRAPCSSCRSVGTTVCAPSRRQSRAIRLVCRAWLPAQQLAPVVQGRLWEAANEGNTMTIEEAHQILSWIVVVASPMATRVRKRKSY